MTEADDHIIIRPPNDREVGQMLEVIQLSFGSWPGFELPVPPLEHLRWKMESHPQAWQQHRVVELDSKIVGAGVRIPREVMLKGQVRLARDGGDLAVHPDYQRRGIWGRMREHTMRTTDDKYDLHIGTSHSPAVVHVRRRREDQSLGNGIQVLLKAFDVGRLVRVRQARSGSRMPSLLTELGVRALFITVSHLLE